MAKASEQRAMIEAKLKAIREQILVLQGQEKMLVELRDEMSGVVAEKAPRTRSPNIRPMVIDYMAAVASDGATTREVDDHVRGNVPTVGKDTVGSVLSRLKSDGALVYDGERYYEKKYAPRPFDGGLRAVF
jgi:hypothetical protein